MASSVVESLADEDEGVWVEDLDVTHHEGDQRPQVPAAMQSAIPAGVGVAEELERSDEENAARNSEPGIRPSSPEDVPEWNFEISMILMELISMTFSRSSGNLHADDECVRRS
jgi:hypothetical protein